MALNIPDLEVRYQAKLNEFETYLNTPGFTQQRCAQFNGELDALGAQLRAAKELEQRLAQLATVADTSHRAAPQSATEPNQRAENPSAERRAFAMALRKGLAFARNHNDAEIRTYAPLDSVNDTQGAFLVPVSTGPEIEVKLKSVGQILSICRDLTTDTGELINWPTSDDTAEKGEFIAQNGAVSQSNPVFGHIGVNAFQWSSKQVLVPLSLLQDSKFDIVAHLTDVFGTRAGRGYSDRVINDGTDGLLVTATGNSSGNMTAAGNTLNYFEPLNLQSHIDLGYNINATYVMNQKTYLGYRSLVTTTGAPLWPEADYKAGMFHGKPFILCQDMPDFGTTGRKYVAYGNFQKLLFRRVGQMSVFRFNELFMNNLQQGFQAYQRVAGKLIQPAAIALLVNP